MAKIPERRAALRLDIHRVLPTWTLDHFGNLKSSTGKLRFHFKRVKWCLQAKTLTKTWVNIQAGYYKYSQVETSPDGISHLKGTDSGTIINLNRLPEGKPRPATCETHGTTTCTTCN